MIEQHTHNSYQAKAKQKKNVRNIYKKYGITILLCTFTRSYTRIALSLKNPLFNLILHLFLYCLQRHYVKATYH